MAGGRSRHAKPKAKKGADPQSDPFARVRRQFGVSAAVIAGATAFLDFSGNSNYPIEVRFTVITVAGAAATFLYAWPRRKGKVDWLSLLAVAAISASASGLLWFVISYDTVRVIYPWGQYSASGSIVFKSARTPVTMAVDSSVVGQTASITRFTRQVFPEGQPARVEKSGSLTPFDQQLVLRDFVRPQEARIDYQLSAPAVLVVDVVNHTPPEVRLLLEEELTWFNRWSLGAGWVLFGVGLLLVAWRSFWRRSPA